MTKKTHDEKSYMCYRSGRYWLDAQRIEREVTIRHHRMGQPPMTLNQMDKFADKVKQLVQDARECPKQ